MVVKSTVASGKASFSAPSRVRARTTWSPYARTTNESCGIGVCSACTYHGRTHRMESPIGIACSVPRRTLDPVWLSSVKSAAYFRLMTESTSAGPSICSGDLMLRTRSCPYVVGSLDTDMSEMRFFRSSFSEKGTKGRTNENSGVSCPGMWSSV